MRRTRNMAIDMGTATIFLLPDLRGLATRIMRFSTATAKRAFGM